jgi:hypothetical protein
LKRRAQQPVQAEAGYLPLQRYVCGGLLERHFASQRDRAAGDAGLGLGDGQSPGGPGQPNGELGQLCLLAHAQCPVRDRHMQLPVQPWHDDAYLRPCGWARLKRLDERRQIPLPILTLAQIDVHRIQTHRNRFGRE